MWLLTSLFLLGVAVFGCVHSVHVLDEESTRNYKNASDLARSRLFFEYKECQCTLGNLGTVKDPNRIITTTTYCGNVTDVIQSIVEGNPVYREGINQTCLVSLGNKAPWMGSMDELFKWRVQWSDEFYDLTCGPRWSIYASSKHRALLGISIVSSIVLCCSAFVASLASCD